jgi:hypothetical protein
MYVQVAINMEVNKAKFLPLRSLYSSVWGDHGGWMNE